MANFLLTNEVLDMLTIFSLLLTFQAISYLMNSLEREFCSFKLQSSNSRLLKKKFSARKSQSWIDRSKSNFTDENREDLPRVTRRQKIRSEHKHTEFSKGVTSHTLT